MHLLRPNGAEGDATQNLRDTPYPDLGTNKNSIRPAIDGRYVLRERINSILRRVPDGA